MIWHSNLGTIQGDSQLNGKSEWNHTGRPINRLSQPSKPTDTIQGLSWDIISEEWENISSEAIEPSIYTLPLDKYAPVKGGQPIMAMVGSSTKEIWDNFKLLNEFGRRIERYVGHYYFILKVEYDNNV